MLKLHLNSILMRFVVVVRCFLHQIRRLIGDFGVPIAIFVMIGIDICIEDAYTQVGVEDKQPRTCPFALSE